MNNIITTAPVNNGVTFDPAIHCTGKDGNPVPTAKGWALKGNRGKNKGNGVTVTRSGFDVAAVSGAYLARVMASGDVAEVTRFSMLKPSEKVAFLATTPEYAETVTVKVVSDAAAKINAILDAAGEEHYHAIMELVRFGDGADFVGK